MFNESAVHAAMQRGEWTRFRTLLEQGSVDSVHAAHMLGASLHGASALPVDLDASAEAYAKAVELALAQAKRQSKRPSVAFPVHFLDAVHAIGAAVEFEEVKVGSAAHAACVAQLKAAARNCGHSALVASLAGDAEATLMCRHALGALPVAAHRFSPLLRVAAHPHRRKRLARRGRLPAGQPRGGCAAIPLRAGSRGAGRPD